MEFKNIEIFEKFIEKNLKTACYDIQAFFEELVRHAEETGSNSYELCSCETKSGLPECIYFDRVDKFFLDAEEVNPAENDFDYAETTIIF